MWLISVLTELLFLKMSGKQGLYKPRSVRTLQRPVYEPVNHAPAVYCIHGRIMHQISGHQTVQNVKSMHRPHRLARQTRIGHRTSHTSNTVRDSY